MYLALEGSGSNPRPATQELCGTRTMDLSLRLASATFRRTGLGCHTLLQGIFLKLGLSRRLHWQASSFPLVLHGLPLGSPILKRSPETRLKGSLLTLKEIIGALVSLCNLEVVQGFTTCQCVNTSYTLSHFFRNLWLSQVLSLTPAFNR